MVLPILLSYSLLSFLPRVILLLYLSDSCFLYYDVLDGAATDYNSYELFLKFGLVEVNGNGDIVRELGKLTELRRLGILQLPRENGMDLCYALEKLKHLSMLYVEAIRTAEPLLHLDSLSTPPPQFIQHLYLKCVLPNLPLWIASLSYLAKLVLQYSNLDDDPLKALQGLPNLVVLELRDAYAGKELRCDDGGYPRLKKLSLMMLRQLKVVRIEQGSMPELRKLDIAACEELDMVPLGIQHLRNLQDLTLWDMPDEFHQKIERPHGEDFWRVQNVTNIQLSKSSFHVAIPINGRGYWRTPSPTWDTGRGEKSRWEERDKLTG